MSNVHRRRESGKQSPGWKNPAPQPGEGRRPRPHCSGTAAAEAAEPQCQAWDPASRPRRPVQRSPQLSPAQPARPGGTRRPRAPRPADATEHPPAAGGRGHPRATDRGCTPRLVPAGPHPAPARSPVRASIPEPAVRAVSPSARDSGATSRARRGQAGARSTGGSRPAGTAPGARQQRSRLGSVVPAARPCLVPAARGSPFPPSPAFSFLPDSASKSHKRSAGEDSLSLRKKLCRLFEKLGLQIGRVAWALQACGELLGE